MLKVLHKAFAKSWCVNAGVIGWKDKQRHAHSFQHRDRLRLSHVGNLPHYHLHRFQTPCAVPPTANR